MPDQRVAFWGVGGAGTLVVLGSLWFRSETFTGLLTVGILILLPHVYSPEHAISTLGIESISLHLRFRAKAQC